MSFESWTQFVIDTIRELREEEQQATAAGLPDQRQEERENDGSGERGTTNL